MKTCFLLDVAPDPVQTGIGVTGLFLIGVVVFMITGAVLLGAVLLFNRIRKSSARPTQLAAGDVCLKLDSASA